MDTIPINELKDILKSSHFEINEVYSQIGISISSNMFFINVSDYNDLIDSVPEGKVMQSVYIVKLKHILSDNLCHNTVARIIRQLRYMWRNCPQFGIEEIVETEGVKKMIYLNCKRKVKLDFNMSQDVTKFFGD